MNDLFISKLHINKVRHLENIYIELANDKRMHLILTGKNGSGKTSLLESLFHTISLTTVPGRFWSFEDDIIKPPIGFTNGELDLHLSTNNMKILSNNMISEASHRKDVSSGKLFADFLLIYMPAHRKLQLKTPKAVEKVDLNPESVSAADLLRYMVFLRLRMLDLRDTGDHQQANNLKNWFDKLQANLSDMLDEPNFKMTFDSNELNYIVDIPEREPSYLTQMPDGYLSLLYFMAEIMMKMEGSASMAYDIPGIVLIDEVETHLHVELQRLVLPFLTKMFPRIQFIVTTHSPFVISSLPNAVVYDLERQIRVEDMSGYSYDAVVEHYYDINQYSLEANTQFNIYRAMVDKENRTPDESEQLMEALTYLNMLPAAAAPELFSAFHDIERQRKERYNNGQDK